MAFARLCFSCSCVGKLTQSHKNLRYLSALCPSRTFSSSKLSDFSKQIRDGPSLADFVANSTSTPSSSTSPTDLTSSSIDNSTYLKDILPAPRPRSVFVETYGCPMNVSDSQIILSILAKSGYTTTDVSTDADVILLNTCAIRDNAEQKIWQRLTELRSHRRKLKNKRTVTVGVLGCMAERLKDKLLEKDQLVDLVVGPDAYRDLPRLLASLDMHSLENPTQGSRPSAINVLLSLDETYADIAPVRDGASNVTAYISIMRGCNNLCSYCIVPFTRGRERSRDARSIEEEALKLAEEGYKEVVLLGQNVNSYHDLSTPTEKEYSLARGFRQITTLKQGGLRFPDLVHRLATLVPALRIRFTSPHPKDFPEELLSVIKENPNVCKSLHIPAQSGSSAVLESMRRGYTRESYLELVERVQQILPGCALSSDFISGFCGETEEDHQQTLSLLHQVKFDHAFMFAYSLREKTHAHRTLKDDVPPEVKQRRLREVISTFYDVSNKQNQLEIGKTHIVLIDKVSRRSTKHFVGRTDTNKKVILEAIEVDHDHFETDANASGNGHGKAAIKIGDFVRCVITSASAVSLFGTALARTTLTGVSRPPLASEQSRNTVDLS
eukprot:TRINITY_DN15025_c0_g1_i1.p1 TRINITY_DN15025_c0_g1~~TRINITY_DN15025_c0_g1_i1.p1  ORF type:complete len:610 (-),score=128.42 TRINITY_DN15025_c0_g1_i1:19-1848(-)